MVFMSYTLKKAFVILEVLNKMQGEVSVMTAFLNGAKELLTWCLGVITGEGGIIPTMMGSPVLSIGLYVVVISFSVGIFARLLKTN